MGRKIMDRKAVIEAAVDTIREDIEMGDVTAIEELLKTVPEDNLLAFLPEDRRIELEL